MPGWSLSVGHRSGLAPTVRTALPVVLTADRTWVDVDLPVTIRLVRWPRRLLTRATGSGLDALNDRLSGLSLLALPSIEGVVMASVSVRDLDDEVRERLRVRAAQNGRSMESEIRAILTDAVTPTVGGPGLLDAVLDRFSAVGGVDLDLPDRRERPRAAGVPE